MSPLARSTNIAARMGRWSASHWKTAVFGWLAFVIAAIAVGMTVTTKQIKVEDANVGQSHKADQILKKGFPQADPQTELVVVQSAIAHGRSGRTRSSRSSKRAACGAAAERASHWRGSWPRHARPPRVAARTSSRTHMTPTPGARSPGRSC